MKVDNRIVSCYQFYSLGLKYIVICQLLNFRLNFCSDLLKSSVLVDQERVRGEDLGKQAFEATWRLHPVVVFNLISDIKVLNCISDVFGIPHCQ